MCARVFRVKPCARWQSDMENTLSIFLTRYLTTPVRRALHINIGVFCDALYRLTPCFSAPTRARRCDAFLTALNFGLMLGTEDFWHLPVAAPRKRMPGRLPAIYFRSRLRRFGNSETDTCTLDTNSATLNLLGAGSMYRGAEVAQKSGQVYNIILFLSVPQRHDAAGQHTGRRPSLCAVVVVFVVDELAAAGIYFSAG